MCLSSHRAGRSRSHPASTSLTAPDFATGNTAVEAGGATPAGAFFDAGEIDEVRLFIAPLVLGGSTARDPVEGMGVTLIADATRALSLTAEPVADDILLTARLREW